MTDMQDRSYSLHEPLLTVENVNLWLGDGDRRRHILRNVDLSVLDIVRPGLQQGQVKGLLGPSGIGKTQLFKILAGFQNPDSGTVKVGKEQIAPAPGRAGVVTQTSQVFMHRRVLSNLVVAGVQGGLTKEEATTMANEYLERFGLADVRDSWAGQLSGGQRQRLAILQQVMVGHELILMDEPYSGLDVNNVEKVSGLIKELTSTNEYLTIVVVTHDIGAAVAVADNLWLLGREKDEASGEFLPGARIVGDFDLIKEGLAWNPDVRQNPRFLQIEAAITQLFKEIVPQT